MSAAPFITVRERAQAVQPKKSRVQPAHPAHAALLVVKQGSRGRAKVKSESGLSGAEFFAFLTIGFAVMATATFMLSVLVGNSMVEMERRKAIDARGQVGAAQTEITRLRNRFDRLNSASEIGSWALARGFVPAYSMGTISEKAN
jgi:hypothetical protein